MRWRCLLGLFAFVLGLFVFKVPSTFADDDAQVRQDAESIRKWIDEGIHLFESTGQIPSSTPPEILLNYLLRFAETKSEDFQNQLEEAFVATIREWYPRYYLVHRVEMEKVVDLESYIQTFRWVSEIVEKKEERFFGRNDATAIDRIGLKVAFISRFGVEAWDEFKAHFRTAWHAARTEAGPELSAQEQALWNTISQKYSEYLIAQKKKDQSQDIELKPEELVEIGARTQELVDEVKVFGEVLLKHDRKSSLFSVALNISHLISNSRHRAVGVRSLLGERTFDDFSKEVRTEYETRSGVAVRKFLETAELGKFREQSGPFSRIRMAAVRTNGEYHLLFRADVEGARASLVVTNPPHRLQKGGMAHDDPKLLKHIRRVKKNVILLDLSKSGARPNEKYSLAAKGVLLRPSAFNPMRYVGDYFLWAYEHPTWGQAFLANGSLIINGGLRVAALETAIRLNPEHIHWNNWAVGLALAYYFGCELFKRWYDNAFASDSLLRESAKKTFFAMFFTTAVFVWLTTDVSLGTAIIMTLPLNMVDKVLSSLSQRMIRSAEREGVIRGDFVVYSGDFSPSYWADVSVAAQENMERQVRNSLRDVAGSAGTEGGLSYESLEVALDKLNLDWRTRIDLMGHSWNSSEEIMTVESEAQLVPEQEGMLIEDLEELERNFEAQYSNELERIVEDGRRVPPPLRRGFQVTPRFEKGLLARFGDGTIRNLLLSMATTFVKNFGPLFQIGYGLAALGVDAFMHLRARKAYLAQGNMLEVARYDKKIKSLVPVLPWLIVNSRRGCRAAIAWMGSKQNSSRSD